MHNLYCVIVHLQIIVRCCVRPEGCFFSGCTVDTPPYPRYSVNTCTTCFPLTHHPYRAGAGLSLLKYFESVDEDEAGSTGGVGLLILKAIHILSNGSDMVVTAMMTSNLCSVLVKCINLFLELPHPAGRFACSLYACMHCGVVLVAHSVIIFMNSVCTWCGVHTQYKLRHVHLFLDQIFVRSTPTWSTLIKATFYEANH